MTLYEYLIKNQGQNLLGYYIILELEPDELTEEQRNNQLNNPAIGKYLKFLMIHPHEICEYKIVEHFINNKRNDKIPICIRRSKVI